MKAPAPGLSMFNFGEHGNNPDVKVLQSNDNLCKHPRSLKCKMSLTSCLNVCYTDRGGPYLAFSAWRLRSLRSSRSRKTSVSKKWIFKDRELVVRGGANFAGKGS